MYGDPQVMKVRAHTLSLFATDVTVRSIRLVQAGNAMNWQSQAADVFRTDLQMLDDVTRRASLGLEDLAAALQAHAQAVEAVLAAIRAAEAWVRDVWNRAMSLLAEAASAIAGLAEALIEGALALIGIDLSSYYRSNDIRNAVPALPASGSREWLDLRSLFEGRGWF